MKLIGLITCLTLFLPLHAHAQIEGGFGLKLGAVLDVDSDALEAIAGTENTVFKVKPPKPLSGFDEYRVYITPLTHKIYQIKAFQHFKVVSGAKTEFGMLKKVLEKKYGYEKRVAKGRPNYVADTGNEGTFRRGDFSVKIMHYSGREIAEVDKITEQYIYPRVVITYRNEDFELRNKEYKAIRKSRNEQREASGLSREQEAESVL